MPLAEASRYFRNSGVCFPSHSAERCGILLVQAHLSLASAEGPKLLRAEASGFPVEFQQQVAMALGLRPAVAIEQVFPGLREDVGDAELVPQISVPFCGGAASAATQLTRAIQRKGMRWRLRKATDASRNNGASRGPVQTLFASLACPTVRKYFDSTNAADVVHPVNSSPRSLAEKWTSESCRGRPSCHPLTA